MKNRNVLPAGYKLPQQIGGKMPVHVMQATLAEGADQDSYLILFADGSKEVHPLSAMEKIAEQEAE